MPPSQLLVEQCQEGKVALKIPLFLEMLGLQGRQLGTGVSHEQIIQQHRQPWQLECQAGEITKARQ